MAFGTWKSPFPRQFGPNSTKRMQRILDALRAELGDAFTTDENTAQGAEIIGMARMLWIADRAIDRRINQVDPRKLSNMLERWEAILNITPSTTDSDLLRRSRVAARLLSQFDARAGSISRSVSEAFNPWTTKTHYTSYADAVRSWPGEPATYNADYPWYSSICTVCVEYIKPNTATDAEVDSRRQSCAAALDEILPAWMSFSISETLDGYDWGFYADISRVDYACVS